MSVEKETLSKEPILILKLTGNHAEQFKSIKRRFFYSDSFKSVRKQTGFFETYSDNDFLCDLLADISDWTQPRKVHKNRGGRPRIQLNNYQVRCMSSSGMSLREIGRKLHVSKDTVANVLKESKQQIKGDQ